MPIINFTEKGSFNNIEKYLKRLSNMQVDAVLNKYGAMGVDALALATPVDSGLSSDSWYYSIVQRKGYYSIRWHNSNDVAGTPLVVLLEYGHGTGTGGYVPPQDFIMQAIQPIFDQIEAEIEMEVSKL